MSRFVLLPGAGGAAWYWSRVTPLLDAAGHEFAAVDLPGDDESAGLRDYAALAIEAADGSDDVVLVAQSMGGFTAPLVCAQTAVRQLVFVNAMIPLPGETAGDWWANTGAVDARVEAAQAGGYSSEFDEALYFLHDVDPAVAAEGARHQRPESDAAFAQPCAFTTWPQVRTRVLAGADDRFFPPGFQRRVALDRLGIDADVLPGGHLIALANPRAVADYLLS